MSIKYLILVALVGATAVAYGSRVNSVVRQADPAAYYFAGMRVVEAGHPTFCDDNNGVAGPYFTLLGFTVRRSHANLCFYPIYSMGLPLLIAVIQRLVPLSQAVFLLVPTLAIAGIVATFALGCELFDEATGLLAAGLLGFNFVYWYSATEIWSDVPASTFLLIGTFVSIRAVARDHLVQGLLAGALFGYACFIRYVSVLAVIPVSVYLWLRMRGQSMPRRALLGLAAGLLPLVLAILAYNQVIYGGFFKTGYRAEYGWVPWPAISYSYFFGESPIGAGGYRAVASTLMENFHIGLPIAVLATRIMPRAKAVLVTTFVLVFCVFYALYAWPPTGINARFLLPVFPIICLAIAYGIVRLLSLVLRRYRFVLIALPLVILAWHFPSYQTALVKLERRNRRTEARADIVREFTKVAEPDAVFLSREYNDLIVLYGQRSVMNYSLLAVSDPVSQSYLVADYESKLVDAVTKLLRSGVPVYVVMEPEGRSFRQGPIAPYRLLSTHFRVVLARNHHEPAIYRVLLQ